MNLPDAILQDAPTLALIVRSKVAGELPLSSYDDAWDALLAEGKEYAPPKEVEDWMRKEWNGVAFGAQPQGQLAEIPQNVTVSRTLARTWMLPFLDQFKVNGGNATKAAKVADIDVAHAYRTKKVDPVFAEAWNEAEAIVADALRAEGWRRGVDGWEEPVYGSVGNYMDGLIGSVRKFDSSVLIKMMTARCPEHRSLVKEGAPQLSATASASASAKSESKTVVSVEEMKDRQGRQRKKLAHQVERARERGLTLGTGKN